MPLNTIARGSLSLSRRRSITAKRVWREEERERAETSSLVRAAFFPALARARLEKISAGDGGRGKK